MSTKKKFRIEDVVGVTHGILLAAIGGIYKVMGHVTGRDLFTHELPAWSSDVAMEIALQHRDLAKVVKFSSVGLSKSMVPMVIQQYILGLRKRFGDEIEIEQTLADRPEPLHGKEDSVAMMNQINAGVAQAIRDGNVITI